MKNYAVVFGCCTEDVTYYNKTKTKEVSFGGKGCNQAIALSKAGAKTIMLTKLSSLPSEKKYTQDHLKNFKKYKVCSKYISYDSLHKNDITNIVIDLDGDNHMTEVKGISKYFTISDVSQNENIIKNASFVLLQLKVPNEVTKEIFAICKKYNVKTCLTPCRTEKARNNPDFIKDATFITLNKSEMINIFGKQKDDKIELSDKQIENVLKKFPNKIILTLGENGVKYFDGQQIIHIPAIKTENVVNTTGAGDTFCGNFIACLLDGNDINTSIKKAICASTIKIQKNGTQNGIPYKKERDKLFKTIYKEKNND